MSLRRIGAILAAWLLLIAAEHLAVGIGYLALIAGPWEMASARTLVTPLLYASLGLKLVGLVDFDDQLRISGIPSPK